MDFVPGGAAGSYAGGVGRTLHEAAGGVD